MNNLRVNIIKIIPFAKRFILRILPWISIVWIIFYLDRHFQTVSQHTDQILHSPQLWLAGMISMAGNWFFRVRKWQFALRPHIRISFQTAFCQQLKTFALSLWTPLNSGEFVGKPMFFKQNKKETIKAVALEQLSQMSVTVLLGLAGLFWFFEQNAWPWLFLLPSVLLYGNSRRKSLRKPAVLLIFSFMRYLFFGGTFVWFLHLFTGQSYINLFPAVSVYYLTVSVIPLLPASGLAVRLMAGMWIFHALSIETSLVASLIFWLWIWNTFIPAVTGLVLHFKKPHCGNY